MPLTDFSSRVISVFEVRGLPIACSNWNFLRDFFIFKFVSLRHILVGHVNVYFCYRLTLNTFSPTLVHFNIVIMDWYDFVLYSIVLPMKISAQVFHTLKIYFRCIVYITI